MKKLNLTSKLLGAVAALVLCNVAISAHADPSFDGPCSISNDVQKIYDWTNHLNNYKPNLQLQAVLNVCEVKQSKATLGELNGLENVLNGVSILNKKSLRHLLCSNPVCSGGRSTDDVILVPDFGLGIQ
jgi:hypothetical protein